MHITVPPWPSCTRDVKVILFLLDDAPDVIRLLLFATTEKNSQSFGYTKHKIFSAFHGNSRFNTVFSWARRFSLSWAWWIHSKPSHPISLWRKCNVSFPLLWSLLRNYSNTRVSITLQGDESLTSHPAPFSRPHSNNTERIYAIGKILLLVFMYCKHLPHRVWILQLHTCCRFSGNVQEDTCCTFNLYYTIINETARLKWNFLTNAMKTLVTLHSCFVC